MLRPVVAALLLATSACAGNGAVRAESLEGAAYRLGEEGAILELGLLIRSEASEPLAARSLDYEVQLGEQAVAVGSASVGGASGVPLPPGGTARIELPLSLSRTQLPDDVLRRLDRGGALPVAVRGNVVLRRPGRAKPALVPFEVTGTLAPAAQ